MSEQTAASPGPLAMLPMFVMIPLIFYLLVFRPQSKERKAHEQMLKNFKKNDEVVTSGGLFGTIVNIKSEAITLRIAENVRVDIEPSAIVRLVKAKTASSEGATGEKRSS